MDKAKEVSGVSAPDRLPQQVTDVSNDSFLYTHFFIHCTLLLLLLLLLLSLPPTHALICSLTIFFSVLGV